MEKGIKSQIKFFADDTSLFSIVTDPLLTANELNHDLKLIESWAYQWKMSFNPDPTKQAVEVLFSRKKNPVYHPPLYFNGKIVTRQEDHKHLGVTLDKKLSFANHIKEKISIARKGIGLIRHLSSYAPVKTLNILYKAYVRPHLDYCDVIYHIPPHQERDTTNFSLNYLMSSIESTQYEAARAVSGAWKGTNKIKLYEELGWESLSDRRLSRRFIQFYKIYNNLTPPYLKSLIPQPVTYLFGLRSDNILHDFLCRTLHFSNSFFPESVKNWNSIGVEFRSIDTISNFKTQIRKLFVPTKKSIFDTHHPVGIKRIFQLRLGLSPLKQHKSDHKFEDTPSPLCNCGIGTEDTEHFLLICPLFSRQRLPFLRRINDILALKNIEFPYFQALLRICLYGHSELNDSENREILKATIKFILDSNRFSRDRDDCDE